MNKKTNIFPLAKLPHNIFQKCSEIWDVPIVLLLSQVCREFNHHMSHNSVWKFRAEKEIPEYQELHPTELKRMQKERFWKDWYLKHIVRTIKIVPPKELPSPPTEWDKGGDLVFILRKGSICSSRSVNRKTGQPVDVFWVCVGHEIGKTMFPGKYHLCKTDEQDINQILDRKVVKYKKSSMIVTGCRPHGGTALDHSFLGPDMY